MKKIITLLFSLFFIGFWEISVQGQTVIIGSENSENSYNTWPAPYGNYEYGTRYQIIIKGSELSAAGGVAGNITSLAFDVSNVNYCSTLNNFTIKIGNSPKPNYETSNTWITGLTTVFTGSYLPISGWNTHTFSNSFYWDGTSDIVIETCFYNSTYSENASTRYSTTSEYLVVGSEGSFDPCSNVTTGYTYYQRPNIKLSMQTSGIDDNYFLNGDVSISPNPNSGIFNVIGKNIKRIQVQDVNGKIILTQDGKGSVNKIDIFKHAKGIYFIKVITQQGVAVGKIMIE